MLFEAALHAKVDTKVCQFSAYEDQTIKTGKKALVRAVNRWDSSFYKGPQADISLAVVTMATGIRVGL